MATTKYKPAFMKAPTPTKMQTYSFPNGNNGGMNMRVQADQIRDDQSPNMLNMCYREGVPSNRYAFNKVFANSWGNTPVRGMWLYRGSTSVYLVAWGGKIYSFNTSTGAKTDLCTGAKTSLTDADTYFFEFDGKCYIFNGTDYCYYDGTNPVADVTTAAYVPTVLIGCAPGATPGGTVSEDYNYLRDSWKQKFSGTASDTLFAMNTTALTSIDSVYANGALVDPDDYTVNLTNGTVTFDTTPGAGTNNVTIQATKTGLMDATLITKCTKFDVYGGKNDNRIFACRENIRYHSGLYDPTYWPENNFALVTNDSDKIQNFGHLLDYHIILKERSLTYSTIDQDSTGAVVWPIYPMNDEYGCLAKDSIKPANNGLIFLAQTNEGSPAGVAFAYPSMVRNQMNVIIISRDINTSVHSELTGLLAYTNAELAAAKAFIYDDKYWLVVDDRCWILDLKYSNFSNGLYCWYPYNGTPAKANCFLDNGGDLYVGDSTVGLIYKEGTGVDEDGVALDFYWTAPIVSCGSRTYTKEFEELAITYGRQVIAQNSLTLITDDSEEAVVVSYQTAGMFDYGAIDYGAWGYGASPYPSTQVEIVGYTAEYLQWIIQNNQLGQGLVILGQELTYKWGERV